MNQNVLNSTGGIVLQVMKLLLDTSFVQEEYGTFAEGKGGCFSISDKHRAVWQVLTA